MEPGCRWNYVRPMPLLDRRLLTVIRSGGDAHAESLRLASFLYAAWSSSRRSLFTGGVQLVAAGSLASTKNGAQCEATARKRNPTPYSERPVARARRARALRLGERVLERMPEALVAGAAGVYECPPADAEVLRPGARNKDRVDRPVEAAGRLQGAQRLVIEADRLASLPVVALRSTSSTRTPWEPSRWAAASPVGPAPTTSTAGRGTGGGCVMRRLPSFGLLATAPAGRPGRPRSAAARPRRRSLRGTGRG